MGLVIAEGRFGHFTWGAKNLEAVPFTVNLLLRIGEMGRQIIHAAADICAQLLDTELMGKTQGFRRVLH